MHGCGLLVWAGQSVWAYCAPVKVEERKGKGSGPKHTKLCLGGLCVPRSTLSVAVSQ